jgi:PAS domain S-box-containing protein
MHKYTNNQLKESRSLLQATLEATADGILVVTHEGKWVAHNQKFAEMWDLPKRILAAGDDKQALDYVLDQLTEPDAFIEKVLALYANPQESSFDVLYFKDGRVFERYSMEQRIEGQTSGRVWSFRDVTERKHIEEKLRASEERFKLAMAGANDGLWDWNLETDEVYYSPRWFDMLGYEHKAFPGVLDTWARLVHPEDKKFVKQRVFDYLEDRAATFEVEMRMQHKDGHDVIVLSRAIKTSREPGGNPVRLVGTHVDITERKQAESFIRNTSDILQMIASGEPSYDIYDAIALMYEARHPGMRCSMLELRGNKLKHGGAPSLPKEYCDAVDGLEVGPDVGSCGTSTYTGKRVLVEDIATDPKWENIKHVALPHGMRCCWSEPVKNPAGKVLGAFGMYYDHPALPNEQELADLESAAMLTGIIMDREHRERSLRQSENKYRTLVENLPQRFFLKDRDSLFISCSKNLAQDLGITPEQIVGTTDYDYFPRDLAEHYRQNDRRVMQTRIAEEFDESIIVDGDEQAIRTVKAPALDENGNVDGVIGIFWDVTGQKALEEQLRQSQKMESVGTLVGGVAHEFNNTLACITGRVYLARNCVDDNHEIRRHLDIISDLSFRAADMIRQLLAFSRKTPVHKRTFDLLAFIKETLKLHRISVPENIKIEEHFSRYALPVNGDATQLQQILVNLLHNARDAVAGVSKPKISIILELFEAEESFVQKHPGQTEKRYAHLEVKDNGCGISENDIDRIFDPFFTTKEVGKGTGLGLSMVYGAIQTHNGLIDVESEIDKGTRVHIYIPLSTFDSMELHEQDSQPAHGQGESILFVDDEPELRSLGREILESLGYDILEASDGSEAIETYIANEKSIGLVIMDVVMPEMGGVEAAMAIKLHNKNAKIIFCTGYDKEDVLDGVDIGNSLVITKPYDINSLSHTIREVLHS